jgi:hypothetical protein
MPIDVIQADINIKYETDRGVRAGKSLGVLVNEVTISWVG